MATFLTEYGLPQTCRSYTCDGRICFYCENPLSKRHEHDHFPVPKRRKGLHTVPVCYNCHDLKDRIRVADWDTESYIDAVLELTIVLSAIEPKLQDESVPIKKCFRVLTQNFNLYESEHWEHLSTPGRILFARLCANLCDWPARTERQRVTRQRRIGRWTISEHHKNRPGGQLALEKTVVVLEYGI